MNFRIIVVAPLAIALFSSCTTTQQKMPTSSVEKPAIKKPLGSKRPSLDLQKLENELKLSRTAEDLGFTERAFDLCKQNFTQSGPCGPQHFSLLHLRIQCRDSVGSVTHVSKVDLEDFAQRNIRWKLGLAQGQVTTDSRGYAQIRLITPGSSKHQKLILIADGQALGLKVTEASRIIVPQDWCRKI